MASATKLFLTSQRLGQTAVRNVATKTLPSEVEGLVNSVPAVTSLDISAGLTEDQKEFQSLALNFANNEVFNLMFYWINMPFLKALG